MNTTYLHTNDGLRLVLQTWQPPEAKAVIIVVHGLGEHGGRYKKLAEMLTSEGYAVVAYDQRGFGLSEGKRGHISNYEVLLQDLGIVMEKVEVMFPDIPHFLYGHSMGGNLVLNYGLRCKPKIAGIIATGPWLRLAFDPPSWKIALAKIMNFIMPAFTQSNGLNPRDLSHDAQIVKAYGSDPLVHDRISARFFMELYQAGLWALNNASQFYLPLLLMHGSADRLTSAEASRQFAEQVPHNCIFKMWPGMYHELFNEVHGNEVAGYMLTWLRDLVNK